MVKFLRHSCVTTGTVASHICLAAHRVMWLCCWSLICYQLPVEVIVLWQKGLPTSQSCMLCLCCCYWTTEQENRRIFYVLTYIVDTKLACCHQKQTEPNVRNKILYLIQAWAHAFRNEPKYKVVQDTYQIMKVEGKCTSGVNILLLLLDLLSISLIFSQQVMFSLSLRRVMPCLQQRE